MRPGVVLLIALAVLFAGASPFRDQDGRPHPPGELPGGQVPSGPTALEEAGLPEPDPAVTAADSPDSAHTGGRRRSSPKERRDLSRRPQAVPPASSARSQPRGVLRRPPASIVRPSPAPGGPALGAEEPLTGVPTPPTPPGDLVGPSEAQPKVKDVQPERLPGEGVPNASPAPAPHVVVPPVLLTAPRDAPPEATRVILDRGLLTPQLRVAALEGRVILAVLVLADGTVGKVKVEVSSGSDLLDGAAVKAAEAWHFRPALRDGVPTASWAIIPVRFVVP